MLFFNKTRKLKNFVTLTNNALNVLCSLFDILDKSNNELADFIENEQCAVDLHHANMLSAQQQILKNRNIMCTIKSFVYED